VTPAEEKWLKLAREKVYWRLWHEAIDELLRHFGAAPGSAGRSNGVTH